MSLQRILGVFFRYFYVMRSGLHHLSDLLYWPLIDILLWGLTSIWMQSQNYHVQNLPLVLMTGLIFWQISWRGSVDISISLLQEFWQHNLVNFFSTPLKFSEWITGILLLSLCKLLITITFGTLLVYFLYALNIFTIGWTFIPFAAALLIFGWAIGFLASSAIIYWGHRVEMFAWMIGGLFAPFSAVFYPVAVLPGWAQVISWCLPTTYIFEGMRSILSTKTFPLHYFWISIALNIIFLTGSILLFKFSFEKSRHKGLARLE
ncbi:MAG TPA: ABC transporter permease [Waddliaceae bacterium]